MYCCKCGKETQPGAEYCSYCGARIVKINTDDKTIVNSGSSASAYDLCKKVMPSKVSTMFPSLSPIAFVGICLAVLLIVIISIGHGLKNRDSKIETADSIRGANDVQFEVTDSTVQDESTSYVVTDDNEAYAALEEDISDEGDELPERVKSSYHWDNVNIGETVEFGMYPMTADGEYGVIEWEILDTEGEKALLLSKYVLDCCPEVFDDRSITWEDSDVRRWLNDDFLNKAFTSAEQQAILTTHVSNEGYPEYEVPSSPDTDDKVFLLSIGEVLKYFVPSQNYWIMDQKDVQISDYRVVWSEDTEHVTPTDYARVNTGVTMNDRGHCYWILRSPSDIVYTRGGILVGASHMTCREMRPAVWVDLQSEIVH